MKHFWVLFCLLAGNYANAQLVINFEDSSLTSWTQYPESRWIITGDNTINGAHSLKHHFDNTESSRDRISYAYTKDFTNHAIKWRFQVKYDYNPSGSNNWGFFLMANQNAVEMHPSGAVDGYVVGVNYSGSDDMVKLWKISSGGGYEVINTQYDWQENIIPGTTVGIVVTRSSEGHWGIKLDESGGFNNLSLIGTGENLDYNASDHIGIYYEYTSSADSKLWIDDIMLESTFIDSTAPYVKADSVLSEDELFLRFSEPMDSASLFNRSNYSLNHAAEPVEITAIDSTLSRIKILFEEPFEDSLENNLAISGIKDENGNLISDTSLSFYYHRLQISNFYILSKNTLAVNFTKIADSASLFNPAHYNLNNNTGNPARIELREDDTTKVQLVFDQPFKPNLEYSLTIADIKDKMLDPMKPFTGSFIYETVNENTLVINEIMADPYPSVRLPDYEYIEIYNPSPDSVLLGGWKIAAGDNEEILPDSAMGPKSYLILCAEDAVLDLSPLAKICALSGFPSLKNSGEKLTLSDTTGRVINSVHYTDEWYQDTEKSDGGYALEKIDPLNNCSGSLNWKASLDSTGGTPGSKNSVFEPNIDTTAPRPTDFQIINSNQVRIQYSEPLSEQIMDSTTLYSIEPAIGEPYSIIQLTDKSSTFDLLFAGEFSQNEEYTLSVKGVYDRCLNDTSFSLHFTYHETEPYDILISEIMADPEPAVGLPEKEYVELFNRSGFTIHMDNWQLFIGNSSIEITDYILPPNTHVIVCADTTGKLFDNCGRVLRLNYLPSINNNEEQLYIQDKKGTIIDFVHTQSGWHENEYKEEGGWSLERIDPDNPCGQESNWTSSSDNNGGTPGKINSVKADNPDMSPLQISHISYIDSLQLAVHFKEITDRSTASEKANYYVEELGHPKMAVLSEPGFKSALLTFGEPFQRGRRYELLLESNLSDCAGNTIASGTVFEFEIPEQPDHLDIVINEILFNPRPGGEDFVELYNRSDKTIDLSDLRMGDDSDDLEHITEISRLFFPGEFKVITRNKEAVEADFYIPYPKRIITAGNLPNYNNTEGIVSLYDKAMNPLDHFEYCESMHFPLLNSNEGVSLERVHYERKTNDPSNWHSASDQAGYATPGYQNSQFTEDEATENRFHVEPEVFTPDNDGRDDLLKIHYNLHKPGYVATIKIFDAKGRMVRHLVNNKTLSTEGTILWNGRQDNNQQAPRGIYVIYIEFFDTGGNVDAVKKHCVVGGRF